MALTWRHLVLCSEAVRLQSVSHLCPKAVEDGARPPKAGDTVFQEGRHLLCARVKKDVSEPTSNHLLLILGLNSRFSGVGSQGISVLGPAPWVFLDTPP